MDKSIVSLSQVCKTYRKGWSGKSFSAIRNIDLAIGAGESVGFIGHNGAGKSSTIRIIMGLQRPTSGSVLLNGLAVDDPESRRGVAYLPETPLAYDYLTPLEVVSMGMAMAGTRVDSPRQHALHWLERFGIAAAAGKPLRQLSKGMVQRTLLAHTLAVDPHFIVLDEPLSGLDPVGRAEVVDILQEYRRAGGALLFSSHILADVERLADRFVFIHQGEIRATRGVFEMLRETAPVFEIIAELPTAAPPATPLPAAWEKVGEQLWRRSADGEEVAAALRTVAEAHGRVLSLRNSNSLESAYLKLVREAG